MSLRAGDTVEHFVIVSPLGEGGMGQVYLARDTRLQRSVALKILQPDPAGDTSSERTSNGAARLLREAQAAAALEHPNVVTIYEVGEIEGEGEEAGRPFIAMELVKGKALRAHIGDASVPMKERIRWLADAARALAAAHRAGLIHRDVKPENVMVRDDGVVKVLDFGLAKRAPVPSASMSLSTEAQVLPSLTGKGVAIGTPYYMAPEQMRREVLDGRADQFAWGVVAYELLSGTPAWGRDVDPVEMVSKVLSETPPPLGDVCAEVPPHVVAVVTRAMAKRRGARFETMERVAEALFEEKAALDAPLRGASSDNEDAASLGPGAHGVETTSAPPGPAIRPHPPRRWGVFAVAGAGLVVASTLAATRAIRGGRSAPPREADPVVSQPIAIADAAFPEFGSPMSRNHEAVSAYRKGMQAFRDADTEAGKRELDRALTLDPDFAAAHLRRGSWRIPLGRSDRQHAREAVRLRDALGPHDRALLDAFAPLLDVPENLAEAARRLAAAFERSPDDADFALALCRAREATGELETARAVCARARELAPAAAAPILEAALADEELGEVAAALTSLDACLRTSPLATSCLEPLWRLQTYEGNCADALLTARRIVSIHPGSAEAYDHLAVSLAGAGEPTTSVRLALTQKLEHVAPAEAKITKLRDTAMLDALTGDFAGAEVQLRAWDAEEAASRFEGDHQAVSGTRVLLAVEQGKAAEAVALLSAYLQQRPAWTLATDGDYSIFFVGELYTLGALPRDEFVAKRTQWLAGARARAAAQPFPWVEAYAIPARSEADAREALDVLPGFLPLPGGLHGSAEWIGPIGKTYRLAGRETEALPFLRHAAGSCAQLESPFEQTAATLELGRALEKVGQETAACEAYRVVVQRWGRARDSVSAATARQRRNALRCTD